MKKSKYKPNKKVSKKGNKHSRLYDVCDTETTVPDELLELLLITTLEQPTHPPLPD
jgi:hypothetical protein